MGRWYKENLGHKSTIVCEENNGNVIFDSVAIGMVSNNKIKGLVPFSLSQVNETRYVKFDITAYVPLKDHLQKGVTRNSLLKLFSDVCASVIDLKKYMIDDSMLMFNPESVFVNVRTGEPGFVINPVISNYSQPNYRAFFRDTLLMINYSATDAYIVEILSLLNGNNAFALDDFYRKLQTMMQNSGTPAVQPSGDIGGNGAVKPIVSEKPSVVPVKYDIPAPAPDKNTEKAEKITGFFGDIAKKLQGTMPGGTAKPEKPKKTDNTGVMKGIAIPGQEVAPIGGNSVMNNEISIPGSVDNKHAGAVPANVPAKNDDGINVVVPPSHQANAVEGTQVNHWPVLNRISTGEKILINKAKFVIGRQEGAVDYRVADNLAVGRNHAYISRNSKGWYIVDMNAKNFTFVNGEKLSAGTEVILNNNDEITLANEKFWIEII